MESSFDQMSEITTAFVFFGTFIYIVTVLVGFFVVNELKETNKFLKKITSLMFNVSLFHLGKDSEDTLAGELRENAFKILILQFPDELEQVFEPYAKIRRPKEEEKRELFEALNFRDLELN